MVEDEQNEQKIKNKFSRNNENVKKVFTILK